VLAELDAAARELPAPGADTVELALWYHDAIYRPRAKDNEACSAALLARDGEALGLPARVVEDAVRLVKVTAHLDARKAPPAEDEAWIIDLDLCILGQEPYRFMDFEHSVAEEHAGIPRPLYFHRRGRFLRTLLQRPALFLTAHFRERYEATARRTSHSSAARATGGGAICSEPAPDVFRASSTESG
jgi:predicted metal-dependent HD superfamily phosphohydrolase